MKLIALALVVLASGLGCAPTPDGIDLALQVGRRDGNGPVNLVEGDLAVLKATADDDGDDMGLCITGATDGAGAIEVFPQDGDCRRFVVTAKAAGQATATFSARGKTTTLAFVVAPLP